MKNLITVLCLLVLSSIFGQDASSSLENSLEENVNFDMKAFEKPI